MLMEYGSLSTFHHPTIAKSGRSRKAMDGVLRVAVLSRAHLPSPVLNLVLHNITSNFTDGACILRLLCNHQTRGAGWRDRGSGSFASLSETAVARVPRWITWVS